MRTPLPSACLLRPRCDRAGFRADKADLPLSVTAHSRHINIVHYHCQANHGGMTPLRAACGITTRAMNTMVKDLLFHRADIGFVFQSVHPLSGLSFLENAPLGSKMGSSCALSYHFFCSSFLVFPPASSASSVLLSRLFGQGSCDSYVSVFVFCVVLPFPTGLLFLRLASAFMGTRSLQVHGQVHLKLCKGP